MVTALHYTQSSRLLKHVVRCYLRLSENMRAREALRHCLPDALKDASLLPAISEDVTVKRWLNSLIFNIAQVDASAPTEFAQQAQAQQSMGVAQQQAMY
jgi:CCR4-NOT transcription complex subunit 9